jgi:hypothetical protein
LPGASFGLPTGTLDALRLSGTLTLDEVSLALPVVTECAYS